MIKIIALLLTSAKLGKLLLVVGSMVLSIWAYSLIFGWVYAVGFVALIFVHEMGHFAAARQKGLAVGAPVFIPFFGAWIALKETPMNVETEAYVAMAGPLVEAWARSSAISSRGSTTTVFCSRCPTRASSSISSISFRWRRSTADG